MTLDVLFWQNHIELPPSKIFNILLYLNFSAFYLDITDESFVDSYYTMGDNSRIFFLHVEIVNTKL